MDLGFNTMLFIVGIFVFIYLAFKRIKKLEAESKDHFKQIDKLGNDLMDMKMELEEKNVISWEKDKFEKKLDRDVKDAIEHMEKNKE